MSSRAYIVSAVRTATGKNGGRLSTRHPAELGAAVLDAAVHRVVGDAPGDFVDDVIFGCVSQVGAQAGNVARNSVLATSSLPLTVPGTTVDRQCGSGQQAVHFAAQAVMSGTQDVVIAGGVEVMSTIPIFSNMNPKFGAPNAPATQAKYGDEPFYSQFTGAELMGLRYGISREEMDEFAARSHARADAATRAGVFKDEIVPVEGFDKDGAAVVHDVDEGIRPGTTSEKLGKLDTLVKLGFCPPPEERPEGAITAGNASQISDGAAALMIVNDAGLKKLGVEPLAIVHTLALAGTDPVLMLSGPIPATVSALDKAGLSIDDMDLYEVNEAFAAVALAWEKELGADAEKLNVNGGACALGHPLGATGAKLMTQLVHELRRRSGKYGLLAICEGGGTANATIIERC